MVELIASLLPKEGLVLELAAGDHSFELAERFGQLVWQLTDRDLDVVAQLAARREQANVPNMLRPLELDPTVDPWPVTQADFVTCIDLVNRVPLDIVHAMFAGASRALPANARLLVTSPLRFHGKFTSPATAELDRTLRSRDGAVRDIRELVAAGTRAGFAFEHMTALPEDHHALVFRRRF